MNSRSVRLTPLATTALTHAVSMLEAEDQIAQERERNLALYRMLVGALRTLAERPSPVVSAAFFLNERDSCVAQMMACS